METIPESKLGTLLDLRQFLHLRDSKVQALILGLASSASSDRRLYDYTNLVAVYIFHLPLVSSSRVYYPSNKIQFFPYADYVLNSSTR